MCKKLGLALSLLSTSWISQAGVINFDSGITGADMAGISVTATFADNTYETLTWSSIAQVLGNSGNDIIDHEGYYGGVFGTNWSLIQQGYTLGNYNSGNIYGLWSFVDNAVNNVTTLKIDTNNTDIMFDTVTFEVAAQDANGSGQGREFTTGSTAPLVATYLDNVQQELYKILQISGLVGDNFTFLADTDKVDDNAPPAVVIKLEELVGTGNLVDNTDIEDVNDVILEESSNIALQTYLNTQGNSTSTLLEAVKNVDLKALPPVGTPDQEAELEAAIQVVKAVIKKQLKEPAGAVTGNGDIEVEIDRSTGEVAIALTVADPAATDQSLDFLTLIDTPDFAFNLNFDYEFTTLTGNLDVFLQDFLIVSYSAQDYADSSGTGFASLFISDSKFFGLTDAELRYSLFPGSPASILLKNINITTVLPTAVDEPGMGGASLAAVFLLLGWRKISNKKS